MARRRDLSIAIVLLLVTALPAAAGIALAAPWLTTVGVFGLILVAPVSYKLARFPAGRTISLGTFTLDARRWKLGHFSSGMLISLSGIDGSGKSSTADSITNKFNSFDVEATTVWGRWRPMVSYPVMGVLYVLLGWRRKDYDQSRILRSFWAYLVLADLLTHAAVFVWPRLLRGEVVCVDRYILDTVVELSYDGLYNERAVSAMRRLLPIPAVTFWLDVPPSVAVKRKSDTQEMLDRLGIEIEAETYLEDRRNRYEAEVSRFDAVVVDTTRSFDKTSQEVTDRAVDEYFDF